MIISEKMICHIDLENNYGLADLKNTIHNKIHQLSDLMNSLQISFSYCVKKIMNLTDLHASNKIHRLSVMVSSYQIEEKNHIISTTEQR